MSRKGNEGSTQQARVGRGMQQREPCFILFSLFDLLEPSPWLILGHVIDHVSPRHCFTLEGLHARMLAIAKRFCRQG
jgi:hypothetical protein